MKLEIYDEAQPKQEEPVRLRLVYAPFKPDVIMVIAVDAKGKRLTSGALLSIYPNGTVWRLPGLDPRLGLGDRLQDGD